jgi:hypothetical protein
MEATNPSVSASSASVVSIAEGSLPFACNTENATQMLLHTVNRLIEQVEFFLCFIGSSFSDQSSSGMLAGKNGFGCIPL